MKTFIFNEDQLKEYTSLIYSSGRSAAIESVKDHSERPEEPIRANWLMINSETLDQIDEAQLDPFDITDGIENTLCLSEFEGVEQEKKESD